MGAGEAQRVRANVAIVVDGLAADWAGSYGIDLRFEAMRSKLSSEENVNVGYRSCTI